MVNKDWLDSTIHSQPDKLDLVKNRAFYTNVEPKLDVQKNILYFCECLQVQRCVLHSLVSMVAKCSVDTLCGRSCSSLFKNQTEFVNFSVKTQS